MNKVPPLHFIKALVIKYKQLGHFRQSWPLNDYMQTKFLKSMRSVVEAVL